MSDAERQWLIVTLVAPMASFGEAPGNARRGSAARPTKSALLGLLGAALGLRREDGQAQAALADGYRVATRTRASGAPLRDFHTYQSLHATSKPPPQTRAEALRRKDKIETSLTVREYRSDVAYDAAYYAKDGARWRLVELAEALRRPVFTLYLGRKSCPLAWPLDPAVVTAETVDDAFDDRDARLEALTEKIGVLPRTLRARAKELAVERGEPRRAGDAAPRREIRRDQPGDRVRWHFSDRIELVAPISKEGPTE